MKYKKHYFNVHLHTEKSVRDGCNTVADLVKRTNELEMKRFIPTDHATISSIYEVFKETEKYGIKGGIGCEFYMTLSDLIYNQEGKKERKSFHITTIVKNDEGYRQMLKLQYLANLKDGEGEIEGLTGSYFSKPRITEKHLYHFAKNDIIVTSGCRLSIFNQLMLNGNIGEAYQLLYDFNKQIENFFIELHVAKNEIEEKSFYLMKKFAYNNNIPVIIANDTHYVNKSDLISWNLLSSNRHGYTVVDKDKGIQNQDFHIKSYEEIFDDTYRCNGISYLYEVINTIKFYEIPLFNDINPKLFDIILKLDESELYSETEELFIGHKILDETITFDWYGSWDKRQLPMLQFPEALSELRKKLWQRLKEIFNGAENVPPQYIERIKEELEIAEKTNNISYFYLISQFLDLCYEADIMLGMGRGSASSLLICYLIRATKVDPIPYNLIIERAMNTDRPKLMDVDLDFCSSESDKVFEILQKMMGKDNVCNIVNYGYNGVKNSLQTVCKYLTISPEIADNLSKEISYYTEENGRKRVANQETQLELLKTSSIVKQLNENPIHDVNGEMFISYVERVIGTVNNLSIHASGVLIMNEPIYNYIPVIRVGDVICSAFDMGVLEELKGLKLDILKISCMDLIKEGLQIRENVTNYDKWLKLY